MDGKRGLVIKLSMPFKRFWFLFDFIRFFIIFFIYFFFKFSNGCGRNRSQESERVAKLVEAYALWYEVIAEVYATCGKNIEGQMTEKL